VADPEILGREAEHNISALSSFATSHSEEYTRFILESDMLKKLLRPKGATASP